MRKPVVAAAWKRKRISNHRYWAGEAVLAKPWNRPIRRATAVKAPVAILTANNSVVRPLVKVVWAQRATVPSSLVKVILAYASRSGTE